MEISVVLPAYQEADNLKTILPKLHMVLKDLNIQYEIVVVDTMTALDDTESVCREHQVRYLPREGGNYYGDAIRTGFAKAEGTYLVVMDADGSHHPNEICNMYREMQTGNYDLIIGSRYCKGGYTDNNFLLRLMSWLLNVTYRVVFHLNVKDVSDSFRMYRTATLKNIQLECDNFDIVEEILIKLNMTCNPFRVKEIPISFSKRNEGKSKRSLMKFIFSYLKTMRKLYAIKNRQVGN